MSVYRGVISGASGNTGNGTVVFLYYTDQETASFGTMDSVGVFTFSEAGTYLVAASCSKITGSSSPDHQSLYINHPGGFLRARGNASYAGWATGVFNCGIVTVAAGESVTVSTEITGYGSDGLNPGASHSAKHLTITKLPRTEGMANAMLRGYPASGTNVTGADVWHNMVWSQQEAHPDLSLNASTGVITCDTTGTYVICFSLYFTGGTLSNEAILLRVRKNSTGYFLGYQYCADQVLAGLHLTTGIDLTAGDTVDLGGVVGAGTQILDVGLDTRFSQFRMSRVA